MQKMKVSFSVHFVRFILFLIAGLFISSFAYSQSYRTPLKSDFLIDYKAQSRQDSSEQNIEEEQIYNENEITEPKQEVQTEEYEEEVVEYVGSGVGDSLPLEPWYRKERKKKAVRAEANSDVRKELVEEKQLFQTMLTKESQIAPKKSYPPILEKEIVPSASEKKQIKQAAKIQKETIANDKEWIKSLKKTYSKGKAETKICNIGLKNFGSLDAKKFMFGDKRYGNYEKQGRAITKKLIQMKCRVVAIQGLIGLNSFDAKNTINLLAASMTHFSKFKWEGHLGLTNNPNRFNGFLVSDDNIKVQQLRLRYYDPLIHYTGFLEEKYALGPAELSLIIKNRETKEEKEIVLITDDLRIKNLEPTIDEKKYNMHIAESLRNIILKRQLDGFIANNAVIIGLINRMRGRNDLSSKILEGTVHLSDFVTPQKCDLEEETVEEDSDETEIKDKKSKKEEEKKPQVKVVVKCSQEINRGVELFGLFGRSSKAVDDQTAEIYMLGKDLSYVQRHEKSLANFSLSSDNVEYGIKTAQIIAVDINW